jgi:hypothetical protein
MENDGALPSSGIAKLQADDVRQSDMQHITITCPSGSRKFTLVAPPFLKLGDEIEGYGTVTKAKMTKGIMIPQKPLLVGRDTPPEATAPTEAKL